MSGKSPALKPEVAQNGVVKIPKAVFESLPPAASAPGESIKTIKRLDGTIEEVKPSLHNKDNPNFVPRQAWPGGNIVTSNKDEALIKYHERKGIPLTPELQAKKAQLDAEAAEKKAAVFSRLGSKGSGNSGTGGRVVKLGGAEGAFNRLAGKALGEIAAPAAAPAAARPPRPKGGVKVLSGAEGAMRGEKRTAEAAADGEADAKRAS
eukprot:Transcript_31527.p1 GENE.Transcript_31527~~Transcript_31527.p1  ORF type:complete len:207 (+),score=77.74 Transcript_31527:91-711(+)